jgi:hypothetical protein
VRDDVCGAALEADVARYFEYGEINGGDSCSFLIGDKSESRIPRRLFAPARGSREGGSRG